MQASERMFSLRDSRAGVSRESNGVGAPLPVVRFRLAWDAITRCGDVIFGVDGHPAVRIRAVSAHEFGILSELLKHPGIMWDGRFLRASSSSGWDVDTAFHAHSYLAENFLDVDLAAQRVIDECESEWPANKSDCSGFVKDVALQFGVTLKGSANEIVDALHGAGWTALSNGKAAKEKADLGKLIVGGLRGDKQQNPSEHGHVVVVVSGPLAKEQYPTAYWGTLGGTGERAKTVNWAWRAVDRDNVFYACHEVE